MSMLNKFKKKIQMFLSKKLIIFDLDGTLTKSKLKLDGEMALLFCRLLDKKKVAVIGGGNYTQLQNQFLKYLKCGNKFENLLILPTSGGALYQYKNEEWHQIYRHILTSSEKNKVFTSFAKAFDDIGYTKPGKTYGQVIEDRETQITFSALGQKTPLYEKEKWNKKRDIRKQLIVSLKKYLPEFEIRLGGLTSIDITKKGIDKAHGVMQLIKLLKMRKRDLLYIGDALYKGGNDYIVEKTKIATLAVKDQEETKNLIRFFVETNR